MPPSRDEPTSENDPPDGAKRRRLTREDWIDAATRRLVARGIDAVRVEPLAATVGVSRGSFYWHFRDRNDLLQAILMRWREYQTRRIVERIREDVQLAPMDKLARLRMLPPHTKTSREAAALELAIRAWAHTDKLARQIVEQVDAERIEFTRSLLTEANMDPAEADYWALIGYAYTLGESLLRTRMDDAQIIECRSRLLKSQIATIAPPREDALLQATRQRISQEASALASRTAPTRAKKPRAGGAGKKPDGKRNPSPS